MTLIHAIYGRRSIRKYKDQNVPSELIEKLLDAAIQAPSSSNLQPWTFVVIQNPELLKFYSDEAKKLVLKELEDSPDSNRYKNILTPSGFNIFYNARTLVIIYAKQTDIKSMGDCSMAAQNLMLTAYSLGLGTCWVGFATPLINSKDFKIALDIPLTYHGVAPIIVGYPDITLADGSRKPPEVLVWKK